MEHFDFDNWDKVETTLRRLQGAQSLMQAIQTLYLGAGREGVCRNLDEMLTFIDILDRLIEECAESLAATVDAAFKQARRKAGAA